MSPWVPAQDQGFWCIISVHRLGRFLGLADFTLLPLAQVPGNLFLIQRKIFGSHTLFTSMGFGNKSLSTGRKRCAGPATYLGVGESDQGRGTMGGNILHHRLTKPSACYICPREPPRREGLPHGHRGSTFQVSGTSGKL